MTNEELVQLHQSGDKQALNDLIEQNKRIVYKIVNKFYLEKTNSIDKEDLIQEGYIGLMSAADKYKIDVEHPCKFSTYAVYWVYQKIQRFIDIRNTNDEMSINTPIGDNDDTELLDTIKDGEYCYKNIEDKLYYGQLRKEIEDVMNEYNTLMERETLKLRYGWNNNSCMTLKDVASIFDGTQERIRYIENRAMKKIRTSPWGQKKAVEIYKEKVNVSKFSANKLIDTISFADKYLSL
ncbi:sigma-70 family RNA polymerase sigma factor [Clostridium akagii]|uniref:sigma-70 family RNA polymerase sigma factor n=1 Tax=Clostridium akagii TaxID=91623 RepID=UPI0004786DC7|nr:sigma-70 family RNA polymerase sigma factor [Clostridium akagii]